MQSKKSGRPRSVLALSISLLAFALLLPLKPAFSGDDLEPSINPMVKKAESEYLGRAKKGDLDAQSLLVKECATQGDYARAEKYAQQFLNASPYQGAKALYAIAQIASEQRDFARAEKYLRQVVELDKQNKNPDEWAVQDHVALAMVLRADPKRKREAYQEFGNALELAKKFKMTEEAGRIVADLAGLAISLGEMDKAEAYCLEALNYGRSHKNVLVEMNALSNQAFIARKRDHDNEKAMKLMREASEITNQENVGDTRAVGLALKQLAVLQHDLGDFEGSVKTYKKAIGFYESDLNYELQADAYKSLGDTCIDLNRISEARDAYQRGLDVLKEEPDDTMIANLLLGLGVAEASMGNFDEALKLHNKAYEMAKTCNNKAQSLEAVLQMGNDLLMSGYPEAGLFRLLEGEKILESSGMKADQKGTFLIAIGRCYKTLGQTESAQKYYEEALKLFDDIGDSKRKSLALTSLAVLALDNSNATDFDKYYKDAKALDQQNDDKRDLAVLDYNYAQFLLISKKFSEAEPIYEQSLAALKGSGDLVTESMILRGLGVSKLLSGHPQQAMPFYENALSLADKSGSIEGQWDSHLGLGKCFKQLGLNDMALSHLCKAVELVEKERGMLTRDSFKTYNLDLRNDCFLELVDLYIRMNKPYEALATAEKGRARAFLDMLSSRKLRRVENFEGPKSSKVEPLPEQKTTLLSQAPAEKGSRAVSVLPKASQIYASSAISPVNAKAPDVDEIKALVSNSKSTLVEYYMLNDRLIVWVIDPDTSIHLLPPIKLSREQLSERVALCYESITHHPKTPAEVSAQASRRQDLLREMYDLLAKPLEPYLPKDENSLVTIVPHGPMFMIPFAALIDENKKFFVEKHTLSYQPAIGVMRATQKLEQAAAAQADKLLAFGNPITKAIEFLGTLPYSEKEVQNIAALFGEPNAVVKIGQDANKQAFSELAPQFAEIHLATHGLVDEEHPMQSSLILAPTKSDDGLLTVKDILAMKELKAKLVVLSACQTGRGKITGDGVVGLSRAFIIAGTPAVLVSQWNVDDIITEFQMKSFYKGYLAKVGKSKALRQAQLDTIKFMEGAGYGIGNMRANPRYWSAFQLIGDNS
ncbi:MAG: CHAT domain-containing protein [Candidatus Obscuribacterales bacterium]|nr:CHAT domain-containing protein [Candidatus Obscuribacterales bacterium]